METQRDLSLAYSPGVAEPVKAIDEDVQTAYDYTNKGNLVGIISNGTAILGLGNRGALASKPVMEGKAVLFKKFADVDVFDIEVNTEIVEDMVETIAHIAPTFGGINLEDIRAPECFEIEDMLRKRLDIPVFHDDQHGTATVVAAGLINALEIQEKKIAEVKIVISGAGAAGIATIKLLIAFGAKKENILLCDSLGVIYAGRTERMSSHKEEWMVETDARSLEDAFKDADVFIGVSLGNIVTSAMVQSMAPKPIIFAMANPDPEIGYDEAKAARDDLVMGTGRSDFPNQVNNVLGFPFIFRGALDTRATTINEEMQIAAAQALANLAKEECPDYVREAYEGEDLQFGPDYIIPKPLDHRVLTWVAPAVAKAAIDTGVARKEVDLNTYADTVAKRVG